jgi:hypothetical protein
MREIREQQLQTLLPAACERKLMVLIQPGNLADVPRALRFTQEILD